MERFSDMNQEPKAVRILKFIVIGMVVILIPISFLIEGTIRVKIGPGNISLRPFEILFLAIPMIGLLLVYECSRSVVLSLKKRNLTAAADSAFVARLAARSAHRDNSTAPE